MALRKPRFTSVPERLPHPASFPITAHLSVNKSLLLHSPPFPSPPLPLVLFLLLPCPSFLFLLLLPLPPSLHFLPHLSSPLFSPPLPFPSLILVFGSHPSGAQSFFYAQGSLWCWGSNPGLLHASSCITDLDYFSSPLPRSNFYFHGPGLQPGLVLAENWLMTQLRMQAQAYWH